ncbi:MAG: hypothetical protein AB4050_15550, partial [Synechococcus sp.]
EKQQAACQRIEQAMRELTEAGTLALGITARCEQLSQHGLSKETLYKNKELWHPNHYREESSPEISDCAEQLTSTLKPQAAQGIEAISEAITDPRQRSLGSSEFQSSVSREIKSEQTNQGGCRGVTDDSVMLAVVAGERNGEQPESKSDESLLDRVKAAAGDCWSVTLERLVEAANPQRVMKALEAYWQQVKRVAISNAGAWLHRAIVEGYEPNEGSTISAEQSEFNEWFELAREAGLAIASESSANGQIWVYLSDGRKGLWNVVRQKYSADLLVSQKSGVESSSVTPSLCQIFKDESQLVTLETGWQTSVSPSQREVQSQPVPMPEDIRKWVSQQKAKRRGSTLGF